MNSFESFGKYKNSDSVNYNYPSHHYEENNYYASSGSSIAYGNFNNQPEFQYHPQFPQQDFQDNYHRDQIFDNKNGTFSHNGFSSFSHSQSFYHNHYTHFYEDAFCVDPLSKNPYDQLQYHQNAGVNYNNYNNFNGYNQGHSASFNNDCQGGYYNNDNGSNKQNRQSRNYKNQMRNHANSKLSQHEIRNSRGSNKNQKTNNLVQLDSNSSSNNTSKRMDKHIIEKSHRNDENRLKTNNLQISNVRSIPDKRKPSPDVHEKRLARLEKRKRKLVASRKAQNAQSGDKINFLHFRLDEIPPLLTTLLSEDLPNNTLDKYNKISQKLAARGEINVRNSQIGAFGSSVCAFLFQGANVKMEQVILAAAEAFYLKERHFQIGADKIASWILNRIYNGNKNESILKNMILVFLIHIILTIEKTQPFYIYNSKPNVFMEAFDKCGLAGRLRDLVNEAPAEKKKELLCIRRKWESLLSRECLNLIDKDHFWEKQGVVSINCPIAKIPADTSSLPPACACIDGASCAKHEQKTSKDEQTEKIHSNSTIKIKATSSSPSVKSPIRRTPSLEEVRIVSVKSCSSQPSSLPGKIVETQHQCPSTATQHHLNSRTSKSPIHHSTDSRVNINTLNSGTPKLILRTTPKKPAAETTTLAISSDSDDDIVILSDDDVVAKRGNSSTVCLKNKSSTVQEQSSRSSKEKEDLICLSDSESDDSTYFSDHGKQVDYPAKSQVRKKIPTQLPGSNLSNPVATVALSKSQPPKESPIQLPPGIRVSNPAPRDIVGRKNFFEITIEEVNTPVDCVDSLLPKRFSPPAKPNVTIGLMSVSPPVVSSESDSDDVILIEDSEDEADSNKKQINVNVPTIYKRKISQKKVIPATPFPQETQVQVLPVAEKTVKGGKRKRQQLERDIHPEDSHSKILKTGNSSLSHVPGTVFIEDPPVLNFLPYEIENKSDSSFVDLAIPGAKEASKAGSSSKAKEPSRASKKGKKVKQGVQVDDLLDNLLAPTLTNFEIVFDSDGVARTKFTHK